MAESTASRITGLRSAKAPPVAAAASSSPANHPQSPIPFDRPMTSRVSNGRVWFMVSN